MKLYPFMTVDSVVRNIVRVSRWLGFDYWLVLLRS